jgi:hypothetical protein
VLTSIGIHPDGIVGHSVGELGCAYADGTFTAEQTVLAAYWRGLCILESKLPLGAMAAVGKSTDMISFDVYTIVDRWENLYFYTPLLFVCYFSNLLCLSCFSWFLHLTVVLPNAH